MTSNDEARDAARFLSERGASSGGRARARKLTPERRSEIAREAAESRWGRMLVATHIGEILIGDQLIACAVLEDGTRVINQSILLTTLRRNRRVKYGDTGRPPVLSAANLQPYVSPSLAMQLAKPVTYVPPGGGRALGYRAEVLPELCEVYLAARFDGKLLNQQEPAADAAEVLVRGLARVGIIALVDEATGYQEVRANEELRRILEAYVQAELRPWLKTFPDEFFQQIYRLQGWEYRPGTSKRTPHVGKLVNKYIYNALPPGVHDELRRLNPKEENGYRRHKHHQFLTANTGHPHLDKQISTVTTLMRIAHTKAEFEDMFERAFPPAQEKLPLMIDPDAYAST